MQPALPSDLRAAALAVLDGHHPVTGRSVPILIGTLILLSALSVGVETLPDLPADMHDALFYFEILVVSVFSAEYLVRLWATRPWKRYAFSFGGIVDLIAVAPSILLLSFDLRAVRLIRLFRLVRLLKLLRFADAMDRLEAAFVSIKDELFVFWAAALTVLYLCAVGIYFFENEAQPAQFASVFHSMWWAVVTLTTVGYGDVYPVTVGGRIFTFVVLILGLGVVAIPAGLMASALSRARLREEHRTELRERQRHRPSGSPPESSDASRGAIVVRNNTGEERHGV